MNSQLVRLCERVALVNVLVGVLASASVGASWGWTLGLGAGGVVGVGNLMGLRWILSRLLARVQQQHLQGGGGGAKVGGLIGLLMVKMAAAVAAVWLVLKVWALDPYGFGLGVTLVVGAVIIVPLLAPAPAEEPVKGPAREA
jgi:hypothetical protein